MLTVAFKGTADDTASTIMMGYGGNYSATTNTHFRAAVVEDNDSAAYLFGTQWNSDKYNCTTSTKMGSLSGTTDKDGYTNITTTYQGTIAWSEADNAFTLKLNQAGNEKTFVLGESYSLEGFSIAMDGNSDDGRKDYFEVSKMSITVASVPEPATATLSLLALAGLAARRRRK